MLATTTTTKIVYIYKILNKPSQRAHIIQASKNHAPRAKDAILTCEVVGSAAENWKKKEKRNGKNEESRKKNLRLCLVSLCRIVHGLLYAGWDGCRHYAWRQYVSIWYYPLFTSINRNENRKCIVCAQFDAKLILGKGEKKVYHCVYCVWMNEFGSRLRWARDMENVKWQITSSESDKLKFDEQQRQQHRCCLVSHRHSFVFLSRLDEHENC